MLSQQCLQRDTQLIERSLSSSALYCSCFNQHALTMPHSVAQHVRSGMQFLLRYGVFLCQRQFCVRNFLRDSRQLTLSRPQPA